MWFHTFTCLVPYFGPNFVLQNAVLQAPEQKPEPKPRTRMNPHLLFPEGEKY